MASKKPSNDHMANENIIWTFPFIWLSLSASLDKVYPVGVENNVSNTHKHFVYL